MSNDEDLYFTFELVDNDNIDAEFELEENDSIDCMFEINAAGAVWGGITGTLSDQEDLQAALDLKADKSELDAGISTLETAIQNEATTRAENDTLLQGGINTLRNDLTSEISNRTSADNTLQGNINTIQTTINGYGNIVTHNVSEFATAAQGQKADTALQPNDNISELVNDAGYITSASLPTVNNSSIVFQKNGTGFDTITLNQANNDTINITVPTQTSELTNNSGFITASALDGYATENFVTSQGYITGINESDVLDALGYTPYNATNPDGYITASDLPTNNVTTDTAQNISGRKTFIGEKAIYFKQSAAADKLGFTLYNVSSAELGAMEWRPNTINGNALFNLNCSQSGSDYVGFRYWSGINIVAPRPTTNGNYFIPTHITNGTLTVTSDNKGTVNISTLLPDVSNFVTNSSLATTLADYTLSSSLASVATSGSYNDLTNKPTIPTVNNGTLTIQANSTTVGTFTANQNGDTIANITIPTDTADLTNGANFVNTTDLATKVNKSGDTMTGDLEINKSIYLTSVAATAANSTSKLYFGPKSSPYNYMAANTSGVFGIYNSSGKGIGCYPTQNLFPTNNIDLGRSNNKWKDIYASGKLYGASTNISITNLISGANAGLTAIQPNDNISALTNDVGYITSASLPTVNDATLTIQKNSTNVGTFTANASVDNIINITVPVNASDVNALPNSTLYGSSIDVSLNTTDYKLTITLKDQNGDTLNSKVVDFPIESVVVNGSYDSTNQKIVLTLQNGNTIDIPVGALIAGLQTEITSTNKLDADLVDDSISTNKFVTASDITTWNGKQDTISDLSTIRSNATNGQSAYTTISGYGNIVTHNVSEFATSIQGGLADTALQPNDNISTLTNDTGYITSSALNSYQPLLVSGTNIKTINNTSVLGNGDIDTSEVFIAEYGTTTFQEVLDAYNASKVIFCYDDNNNTYAPITNYTGTDFYFSTGLINNISASYTLDDNDTWDGGDITLATVATSGSYNDLSNKPTIPSAQVQANWNETDTNSMAYIQNKPNIPSGVVVDQVYDGTSANAQSGVAMAGELANYTKTANLPLTPYFATSSTAAATATKVVSIPAITTLNVGQIICVKPTITSTVATSKIKLNDFTAYNMRYNGANITTSTDSVVWNENWVSWFVFDGTYWQFAGHGYDNNTNTTYSAMSVSEGVTGTATNSRTVRADYLKQIIQGTKLTGLDTSDNSAVEATDDILTSIGKLQAEVESAYNKAESKADWFEIDSPLTSTYDNTGIVLGTDCYITSDGVLTGGTAWNDGIMDAVTSVNLINDYWEWNGYFKFTSISAEEELIAVDGVNDNGFLFHIKPNGDVINPDDNNKVLANVGANDWVEFNVIHQAGDTDITVTLDTANGKVTTTTALATTTAQALHNTCWHCNNSYGIEFLVRNDESWWKKSAGGTFYPFVTRYIGADLSSKQDALVSGTNIKTINNTSLLGSGNIDTSQIFFAQYGTTTTTQINQALSNGKTIICTNSTPSVDKIYYYSGTATIGGLSAFTFSRVYQNTTEVVYVSSMTNQWYTITKTLANDDLSNVSSIDSSSAVATELSSKVNKSGDTMTGGLTIEDASFTAKGSNIDFSATPSTNEYFKGSTIKDVNDNTVAFIECGHLTTNTERASLVMYSPTFNAYANVNVGFDANGNRYCDFPNTACVDGQWIASYQEAIGSTAQTINAQATKEITFSNLPAKKCEVMFTISQSTNYDLAISSNLIGGTVNRALKQGSICMIMPVSSDKKIKVSNLGSGTASINFVRMAGYRIIGSNTNT